MKNKYVIVLLPSPFAPVHIYDRFCAPIEIYCECESMEIARFGVDNNDWSELQGTEWEAQAMSRKLFDTLAKNQAKKIEAKKRERLEIIAKYKILLSEHSAASIRAYRLIDFNRFDQRNKIGAYSRKYSH